MYIISLTYKQGLEKVDAHLAAHVEYLKAQYEAGIFLASGRKIPRTGGIILARAENRDALMEIVAQDPFYRNDVADYDITEFSPTMTCKTLECIKE